MNKIKIGVEILPREFIEEINTKGKLYLVGGAVRDYLITGSFPDELDFLVMGIPLDNLLHILRNWGSAIYVGRSFGVIKFVPRSLTNKEFEFSIPSIRGTQKVESPLENGLAEDLAERDFTVNSMALEIQTGKLNDPFGGQKDIACKILRPTSVENLVKDPVRMLRAVRLAVQLGFSIDKQAKEVITDNAHLLTSVAPERIRDELIKLLLLPDPFPGFLLMRDFGIIGQIMPELKRTYDIEQGGQHQFALFEHTIRAVKYSAPELRLRLAALLHDIAKPICRKTLPNGRVVFYGHDVMGAKIARSILKRFCFSSNIIEDVAALVRYHMFSYGFSDKGLRRFIRRVGTDRILLLMKLRFADTMAQHDGQTLRDEERFERRVINELNRKPPMTIKDLDISGYDIMDEFKLSPGPMVGKILKHLLTYVLDSPEHNTKEILMNEAKGFVASLNKGGK